MPTTGMQLRRTLRNGVNRSPGIWKPWTLADARYSQINWMSREGMNRMLKRKTSGTAKDGR